MQDNRLLCFVASFISRRDMLASWNALRTLRIGRSQIVYTKTLIDVLLQLLAQTIIVDSWPCYIALQVGQLNNI